MKVLLVHNYYQQAGGEDSCFADEGRLLEERGHTVVRYTRSNDDVARIGAWKTGWLALWNRESYRELRELIRRQRPQVMHCTNVFPLVSPAAYYAARAEGVAVVQALHNFRLLCPNAQFLRDGHVCEDCLGKFVPWPAVWHACYRESRAASAAVATMLTYHRGRQTWQKAVDRYYALNEFCRRKFVQGGLPADKLAVKPNFVHDPGTPGHGRGGYAAFVGRLSVEKGIHTLLTAWQPRPGGLRLKIVGDGPLAAEVAKAAAANPAIEWLGRRPMSEVLSILGDAAFLVLPSVWYENFPRTIVESYSVGTPVLASRLGALAEVVADGRLGLLFQPGDHTDLAAQAQRLAAWADGPALRRAVRNEYLAHYTPERNYALLMAIYRDALAAHGGAAAADDRETMSEVAEPPAREVIAGPVP